ncbi:flavodoxin domain-containing protein [Saccharicrinis fermentans]|uniref:flavodoxin domain-containing protein n=2 Tax=Saccharicrinis fermentans TaxID=982 RepID=UPI0006932DD0|nr:flavodoxin domain-containing protein [Saccharicrinis fermentans]
MEKTAVLVGSSTGNTESVGEKIVEKLGNGAKLINVADASVAQIEDCKNLILGTSTWGVGDLQDDWEDFLPKLAQADLNGKTVALFGLGDAESYYDSFVDGIGTIYEEIKDKGIRPSKYLFLKQTFINKLRQKFFEIFGGCNVDVFHDVL